MKTTVTLFAFFFALVVSAQTYQLTENGLVNLQDPSKDYTVLEFDGQDQETLYANTLSYLQGVYDNPDGALSTVANESISVKGKTAKKFKGRGNAKYKLFYDITIRFKDGKLRIDTPSFNLHNGITGKLFVSVDKRSALGNVDGIWVRGDLKIERAKTAIEDFFNGYVSELGQKVTNDPEW